MRQVETRQFSVIDLLTWQYFMKREWRGDGCMILRLPSSLGKKIKIGSQGFQSIDGTNAEDAGFLRSSLWPITTQPKMKDQTKVAFSSPPKVSYFPHSTNLKI